MKDDRKTLALIDGASLHKTLALHGVREINASVLLRLLHTQIPGLKRLLPPVITMLPDLADNSIGRAFRKKGFNVIPAETQGEKDDFLLCHHIKTADTQAVEQIVMVSSDSCYLKPLWEKRKQGVGVCWFIPDSVGTNGNTCIGRTLRRFFSCGMFTWVDMKPYLEELRYVPGR